MNHIRLHTRTAHMTNVISSRWRISESQPSSVLNRVLYAMGVLFLSVNMATASDSAPIVLDDFSNDPQARWEFIADTVMGGVSKGNVQFVSVTSPPDAQGNVDTIVTNTALKLNGTVSTANNGGFIQARLPLDQTSTNVLPDTAKGIWLKARGNDQPYFVHIRTSGTLLPWQYYQANFNATETWQVVQLPWDSFKPSGGLSGSLLREVPLANKIKSIAIVAFGRDHEADVEVAEIGYY